MAKAKPKTALPVVVSNSSATFECTFGRGCEGLCCKNGRPSVDELESQVIAENLQKFLPHLRIEARQLIEKEGFISNRKKLGQPMLRVSSGWCVFFNSGCVLHKVGMEDGDSFRYKPSQCALFPLERGDENEWFVRQWDYRGEKWDLFCLNPANTKLLAIDSLSDELKFAAKIAAEEEG